MGADGFSLPRPPTCRCGSQSSIAKPIGERFTLLIQHAVRSMAIRRTLPHDDGETVGFVADAKELRDACRRVLLAIDLGRDEVDACLALVMSSL